MENASKALLIAAEVLIAMLVVSMFTILFSTVADYSEKYAITKESQEIEAFNTQFTNYTKEEEITAQDVVSVINLAKYYNAKGFNITASANGNVNIDTKSNDENVHRFMEEHTDVTNSKNIYVDFRFELDSIGYDQQGRINSIIFDLKSNKGEVWRKQP